MMRCSKCEAAMAQGPLLPDGQDGYFMLCSVKYWQHPWRVFYNATYNEIVGVEPSKEVEKNADVS
jgi:hypothetical protein